MQLCLHCEILEIRVHALGRWFLEISGKSNTGRLLGLKQARSPFWVASGISAAAVLFFEMFRACSWLCLHCSTDALSCDYSRRHKCHRQLTDPFFQKVQQIHSLKALEDRCRQPSTSEDSKSGALVYQAGFLLWTPPKTVIPLTTLSAWRPEHQSELRINSH